MLRSSASRKSVSRMVTSTTCRSFLGWRVTVDVVVVVNHAARHEAVFVVDSVVKAHEFIRNDVHELKTRGDVSR